MSSLSLSLGLMGGTSALLHPPIPPCGHNPNSTPFVESFGPGNRGRRGSEKEKLKRAGKRTVSLALFEIKMPVNKAAM